MAKNYTWKALLRRNLLTKDVENDYIAEVSTTGKIIRNEEIAKAIKEQGSELHYETLLDVLNRGDQLRRRYLQEGHSVHSGVCHFAPRIAGSWVGTKSVFDPGKHKITIDAVPTTEMRAALEEVGVEVVGVQADGGARIDLVTDSFTGKTDGTISIHGDIIIEGEKIRIAPADKEELGVFLVAADGTEYKDYNPLVFNDPKRVVWRVPSPPAGAYTLKIKTQYSNGNTLLKAPRVITYWLPLTIK
ncbi:MAG: DUF4469 domain-containing protein [Prevotellaceae bacterium]|jgi:hypothetical protein|nr:DUF4469 domain-containing protein [Prevotellaceae bacterium]